MAQKPSIPKGTRDFSPSEMSRRNYIFNNIREVFRTFGYAPLETPAMENLITLLGKYGEEGDKLLFRILNSGNFTDGVDMTAEAGALAAKICEKGLRYDLTVPFARYVVQHQNEITFPFRRSQIQPVWRADRPQKGRYREFYQCDVDIIGSRSILNEYELVCIVEQVFERLGIDVVLKINNRKILYGIAESIGFADKMVDITVAIDKLDKIGMEGVEAELSERGISHEAIEKLKPVLALQGSTIDKLTTLKTLLADSGTGLNGIEETEELFGYITAGSNKLHVELDLSLARGLNYYTGAIFEVKAKDVAIGSICGGGRYDNLTGIFGLPDTSGVGISFGADRIYDVMNTLELFPVETEQTTRVLVLNFGGEELKAAIDVAHNLRVAGIATELYPDTAKIKKQMEYASRRRVPYVVIIGETERLSGMATLKNMNSGEQTTVNICDIYNQFKI